MDLSTITIPRAEARQSYLEYRREAQRTNDLAARGELEELAHAFRIAAKEDLALIALTPTVQRAGTLVRTHVAPIWREGNRQERRTHYLLPKLAIAPVEARFVFSCGVQRDGSVEFIDSLGRRDNYRRGRLHLETSFELPSDFGTGQSVNSWTREAWSAMVPVTPPKHRPSRAFAQCHVLWEADDWTWATVPAPPGDPALLRHVAGDIYAVLATWDLSPLERLVLSGRSLEEAIV